MSCSSSTAVRGSYKYPWRSSKRTISLGYFCRSKVHRGIAGSIDHLRFSNELRPVRPPAMWQWRHSTKSWRSSWEGGRSFGGWDIWTISCYNWEGHERTYGKLSEHLQQCIPLASSAMERNSLILYATFLSGVISNDDWTLKSMFSFLFFFLVFIFLVGVYLWNETTRKHPSPNHFIKLCCCIT